MNVGTLIAKNEPPMIHESARVPRLSAAARPRATPMVISMTIAMTASNTVRGNRSAIIAVTGRW